MAYSIRIQEFEDAIMSGDINTVHKYRNSCTILQYLQHVKFAVKNNCVQALHELLDDTRSSQMSSEVYAESFAFSENYEMIFYLLCRQLTSPSTTLQTPTTRCFLRNLPEEYIEDNESLRYAPFFWMVVFQALGSTQDAEYFKAFSRTRLENAIFHLLLHGATREDLKRLLRVPGCVEAVETEIFPDLESLYQLLPTVKEETRV